MGHVSSGTRKNWLATTVGAGLGLAWATVGQGAVATTHDDLQAVDAGGNLTSAHVGAGYQVIIEGIALNNPEEMLNPAAQWQVAVQGEGTDQSGTFAWAGSFYGQQDIWEDELARLNGSGFRAGDRIRITGFVGAVGGKANINERHSPSPGMDFTVELLSAGVGLPEPAVVTLGDMGMFDATRQSGGERYQGRLVRANGVMMAGGTWGSNSYVTVEDGSTDQLPLRLGNVDVGIEPAGLFHVVAIGNQEPQFGGSGPIPGTGLVDGYELFAADASGIIRPGDLDLDGTVSFVEAATVVANIGLVGATHADGDFDLDGEVGLADAELAVAEYEHQWGVVGVTGLSVPEPSTAGLVVLGVFGAIGRRRRKRGRAGFARRAGG